MLYHQPHLKTDSTAGPGFRGLALEALHVDLHEVDGQRCETSLREDLIEALHLGKWIRRMVSLAKNMEKRGEMLGLLA
jgi:hypothetical protein